MSYAREVHVVAVAQCHCLLPEESGNMNKLVLNEMCP